MTYLGDLKERCYELQLHRGTKASGFSLLKKNVMHVEDSSEVHTGKENWDNPK